MNVSRSALALAISLALLVCGCKTAAKQAPDAGDAKLSAEALEQRGDKLAEARGKAEEAIKSYDAALQKGGPADRLKYKQGFVLLREGQWTLALDRFEQSLTVFPDSPQALQGAGFAAFKLSRYELAEQHLSKAVSLKPDLPGVDSLLGVIHNAMRRPDLAVADFTRAIAQSGPSADLENNLGVAYLMSGNTAKAEEAFGRVLARGPNKRAANNLGLAYCRQKKYEAAFEAFKRAGSEAAAYNNTGVCLQHDGQKARAAEYFQKAIEASPKYYPEAERNLSQAGGQAQALDFPGVFTAAAEASPGPAPSTLKEVPLAPSPAPAGEPASPAAKDKAQSPGQRLQWPEHAPLKAKAPLVKPAPVPVPAPATPPPASAPAVALPPAPTAEPVPAQAARPPASAPAPLKSASAPAAQVPAAPAGAETSAPPVASGPAAQSAPASPPLPAASPVPAAPAAAASSAGADPSPAPVAAAPPLAETPRPAGSQAKGGKVLDVVFSESGGDYRLTITTDAPVEKAEVFAKKSPPAVGVDLLGPWRLAGAAPQVAAGEYAQRLRVGAHPDKLRIMLDLASETAPRKAVLEKTASGIVVVIRK